MATIDEALAQHKLDVAQITINEIEDDSSPSPIDIDRLTIQSPTPRFGPGNIPKGRPIINEPTIIGYPPHNHGHPRTSSPTGSVRSSFTSRRRVSRHRHWSHSHTRSHHSEFSKELTVQAEKEFFALMELMSGVSRRSASLKEVWTKMISERESYFSEMDQLYEQCEEYSETIERHEKERHNHNHEHEERKKEIVKLQLELKVAAEASVTLKKKLSDRDDELDRCRGEIEEFNDNFKYLKVEHEETKKTLEETHLKLVAAEERCRHAEDDSERHHGEIRSWKQKYLELESSRTELSTKFESTQKEMLNLKQVNVTLKKEKHDWLHEKGELEDDLRKCRHHEHELKRKVKEITESYEKKKHEVHELTEKVTKVKHEREELHKEVKMLKIQLEEANDKCEASDDACRKWKRKWDECEHDLITVREEFRLLEIEHTETKETIIKKTEEIRRIIFEKEQLQEDYHAKCKEAAECHRQILVLQESIRRSETTIKEKSETIHTLTERVERVERERNDACKIRDDLRAELSSAQSTVVSLNLSLETSIAERDTARESLRECETRYESVCESMTEYHEGSSGFEERISHLREMLEETKEQKEKAIRLRKEADRERDESVTLYEAKCREVERLKERLAGHSRLSGGRTVRQWHGSTYSRSVIGEEDESRSVVGETL